MQHLGDLKGLEIFRPLKDPLSLWIRLGSLIEGILKDAAKEPDEQILKSIQRAKREFGPYTNDLAGSLKAVEAFFSEPNLSLVQKLPVVRGQGVQRIEVSGTEVRVTKQAGS